MPINSTSLERANPGFLQVLPEQPVDQSHGGKVLHAAESNGLDIPQEGMHHPERIGPAHAGENRKRPCTTGSTSPAISTTIWLASP